MSTPPPGSYGDSLVGRTLSGVYRLVDLIGTGGFADVYLARDLRTNVTVAVKILHAHVAREAGLVQRFNTEVEVARRLHGLNVARALDSGQEAGIPPYMVMEYVQGLSLAEIIRRRGQLPVQEATRLVDQMLSALSEAHGLGIVHRDIKPANLMVDAHGTLKVMDFGIARLLERGGNTTIGHVLGTPAYMAPEQVAGQPVDIRTDLYAVGIVLYELLAGRSPFGGTSDPMVAMARVMNEAHAPLAGIRNDVPLALSGVLDRALSKSPDWRFQSAHEMRQALSQAMSGPPTAVMSPAPTHPFGVWSPPLTPGPPPGPPPGPTGPLGQQPLAFAAPPQGAPNQQPGYGTPVPVYGGANPPPGYSAIPQPPYDSPSPPRPGPRPPLPTPAPARARTPVPLILGIGAVALLLLGGFVGLLSTRGFGGATATPTPVRQAVATPTTSPVQPTPSSVARTQVALAPTGAPTSAPTAGPTTAPTAPPKPQPTAPPKPQPSAALPTDVPPAAVPPTVIPARPTATLMPRSVFQANFNNGDPRGLFIGFTPDREREHLLWEGEYTIKTLVSRPANSIAFIPNTQGVTDGVLAANVRIIDGADYAFVSLNCRAQNTDQISHYSAQLTSTPPAVRLRRVDAGTSNALVDWTQHPAIHGGRTINRLEVRCIGSTIAVAVNGVQIISFQDERYQGGWWSVGAGTFGDMAGRAEGRFDDIDLRAR
jgi:serine/threonine protein kinase